MKTKNKEFNLSEKRFHPRLITMCLDGESGLYFEKDVKEFIQNIIREQSKVLDKMPMNEENYQITLSKGTIMEMMRIVILKNAGDKLNGQK